MKIRFVILSLFASFFLTAATPPKNLYLVYVFMGEECVISQNYTLELNKLHEQYASDRIQFIGVFPSNYSSSETVKNFKSKYKLPFNTELDKAHIKVFRFQIKVTPEIVVYDVKNQNVVYQGRIDNTYFGLGQRRTVTTTSELSDVLSAITKKEELDFEFKKAVGCFLTPIDPLFKDISPCNYDTKDTKTNKR